MGGQPARARHMAVTPSGNIFVAINSPRNEQPAFGIIGLRDTNGDGVADEQTQFSPGLGGSGIAWIAWPLILRRERSGAALPDCRQDSSHPAVRPRLLYPA